MRRRENFWAEPVRATFEQKPTGEMRPHITSYNTEHVLSVTLAVTFWANSAQMSEARQVAERALADLLYRDVLGKLSQIEHAVMDSDGRRAFAACGELREMLTR